MKQAINFFAERYRQALLAVYRLGKNIYFHEASLLGGVVGGTSILPTRMASLFSSNTSSTWCAASPQLRPVYGQGAFYS